MNGQSLQSPPTEFFGGEQFGSDNMFPLDFYTNNIFRMRIGLGKNSSQNTVGIGTTSPNYDLHIHSTYIPPATPGMPGEGGNGNIWARACLQLTTTETGDTEYDGLRIQVNGNRGWVQANDLQSLSFTNDMSSFRMFGSGHISFFSDSENSGSRLYLKTDSDNGFIIKKQDGTGSFGMQVQTSNAVLNAYSVKQGTNEVFVVKNNGRVGVGTSTPDANYMLDVAGKMRACEVRVNNPGWCDYVFAPGYNLMSLGQLAAYIDEHHHLPEMPSTAEVEADGGFDLAQMSTALLKRSEENTLYILGLEQKTNDLKTELAAQTAALQKAQENAKADEAEKQALEKRVADLERKMSVLLLQLAKQ